MALIKTNLLVDDIRGVLGNMVIARHKPGISVARKRPERTAPPTAGELANRDRMRQAIAWGKAVWAEQPQLRERYLVAAKLQGRRGFDLVKADFLRSPEVDDIDLADYTGQAGEPIRVQATDDFEVAQVTVRIQEVGGGVLEEGAAVHGEETWIYTSKVAVAAGKTVQIEVTATDHPGHSAIKKVDHACGPRD